MPTPSIPLLTRRRIEAELLAPVARALEDEIGPERAASVLRRALEGIAEAQGRALRADLPVGGLASVAQLWDRLAAGGSLDLEVEEQSASVFRFRVTRCRYAEMYREQGLASLGHLLSCARDAPLLRGLAPELSLEVSGNLLAGDPCCRFTYRHDPKAAVDDPAAGTR